MKRILKACLLLTVVSSMAKAQTKDIELSYTKKADSVYISMTNNTEKDLRVKVELKVTNLTGYRFPISKSVDGGQTVPLITLGTVPLKGWTYNYSYWTKREYKEGKFGEAARLLDKTQDEIKNSILVFDKDGCSRCDRTLAYFEQKKVPHHVLNISESQDSDDLMFRYLLDAGFNASVVTTPVLVVDGKVHYSIPNLDFFMNDLRKKFKKRAKAGK